MASESRGIWGIDPPSSKSGGIIPPTFQAKLRLHTQLLLLPELCKRQSVTNIGELKSQLVDLGLSVYMFSEVKTLLKLFYVIPGSSATAERSFSVMRRVKNYLRTTMTSQRLNSAMLLHVHRGRAAAWPNGPP